MRCRVPTSQRSSINPAALTTPRMSSIIRGQNSISRANSDPLPPRYSVNKHTQFSKHASCKPSTDTSFWLKGESWASYPLASWPSFCRLISAFFRPNLDTCMSHAVSRACLTISAIRIFCGASVRLSQGHQYFDFPSHWRLKCLVMSLPANISSTATSRFCHKCCPSAVQNRLLVWLHQYKNVTSKGDSYVQLSVGLPLRQQPQ